MTRLLNIVNFRIISRMGNASQKILIVTFICTVVLGGLVLLLDKEYRIPLIIASNSTYYPGISDETIRKHAVRVRTGQRSSFRQSGRRKAPAKTASSPDALKKAPAGKVNINAASKEALQSALGISPDMADKVIFYRNIHKGFKTKDELLKIPGVTREMYDTIAPFAEVP